MSSTANKPLNICIVSEQLAIGGAERCSAILSQFLEKNNCKVHHIITIDKIEYAYNGRILNLGKPKFNGIFGRVKRLLILNQFFKKNKFDFIIDTRVINKQWQELFVAKYIYNAPKIKVVHSFMTNLYFPKNNFLANLIYSDFFKIVTVSNQINQKVKTNFNYKKVETIYNPIDFETIATLKNEIIPDQNFIVAVGSMNTDVKQFDVLITCYSKSVLPQNNVKLLILGDGIFKSKYLLLAKKLNLKDKVIFKGHVQNPFSYFKEALFTILTSKNEGFPTVLIESLACQTPVVAYNCDSGPSEIIINNENGILVENQNQQKMIDAINEMYYNKNLYLHCKQNAFQSVQQYSIETIGNQWLKLLKAST